MTFKEGDVVNRKTGGPLMTVEEIRLDALVATVWFDRDCRVNRDCFDAKTLQQWVLVEQKDPA